jgi:hypothetical protein
MGLWCRRLGGAEELARWWVVAGLGDGDAVQGRVELPVPDTGQSVTFAVAGPDWDWRGAVVAGVGVAGSEPVDVRGLAEDLCRGQCRAAAQFDQRGSEGDLRVGNVSADAVTRLAGYLSGRHAQTGQQYVGVITDGAEWHRHHLVDGALQARGGHNPRDFDKHVFQVPIPLCLTRRPGPRPAWSSSASAQRTAPPALSSPWCPSRPNVDGSARP